MNEWTDERAIEVYNRVFRPHDYCAPDDNRAYCIADEMRGVKYAKTPKEAWMVIGWWGWSSHADFLRAYNRIKRHK